MDRVILPRLESLRRIIVRVTTIAKRAFSGADAGSRQHASIEHLEERMLLSATLSARITALQQDGTYTNNPSLQIYSGEALHVDAVGMPDSNALPGSTYANFDGQLDTQFQWNFGDPSGKYNTLPGYNAAHVYDAPGTYTVLLNETEGTATSQATLTVNVVADPSLKSLYVAAPASGGSPSNSGADSAHPIDFATLWTDLANPTYESHTQVLFNRGDTFTFSYALNLYSGSRSWSYMTFGDYGNLAKPSPVLEASSANAMSVFFGSATSNGANEIMIEDIAFNTAPGSYAVDMVDQNATTNLTIRNCTYGSLSSFVNDAVEGPNAGHGLLVQDNADTGSPTATPNLSEYFMFWSGNETAVIGNTVYGTTQQHDLRCDAGGPTDVAGNQPASCSLIYQNELWNGLKTVTNWTFAKSG